MFLAFLDGTVILIVNLIFIAALSGATAPTGIRKIVVPQTLRFPIRICWWFNAFGVGALLEVEPGAGGIDVGHLIVAVGVGEGVVGGAGEGWNEGQGED